MSRIWRRRVVRIIIVIIALLPLVILVGIPSFALILYGRLFQLAVKIYPPPRFYIRFNNPLLQAICIIFSSDISLFLPFYIIFLAVILAITTRENISFAVALTILIIIVVLAGYAVFYQSIYTYFYNWSIGSYYISLSNIICPYSNYSLCRLWSIVTNSMLLSPIGSPEASCYYLYKKLDGIDIYSFNYPCALKLIESNVKRIVDRYGIVKPCLTVAKTVKQYITCVRSVELYGVVRQCLKYAIWNPRDYYQCIRLLDR